MALAATRCVSSAMCVGCTIMLPEVMACWGYSLACVRLKGCDVRVMLTDSRPVLLMLKEVRRVLGRAGGLRVQHAVC